MDASQYKDYVLVLLFIKYVSDKFAGQPYAAITVPPGASFADMVALKGRADIGDQINKKIVGPLAAADKLSDMPDFNDAAKLGSGKEMVDRLGNLIAIFENKALDFSKNRADGDDILGDAYEFLMRHFVTESGKSKRQYAGRSEPRDGAGARHCPGHHVAQDNGVRPDLRLGVAAVEGGRRSAHAGHVERAGKGRRHR